MKHKEKLDAAFALYTIVDHYDDIEHTLFSGIYDVTIICSIPTVFFSLGFRNFEMQISVLSRIIRFLSRYQYGKQQKGPASIIHNHHTDPFCK